MSPMTATGLELSLVVAPYSSSDLVRTYAGLKTFVHTVFTRFAPKTRAMAQFGVGFIIGNTTKTGWQSEYQRAKSSMGYPLANWTQESSQSNLRPAVS